MARRDTPGPCPRIEQTFDIGLEARAGTVLGGRGLASVFGRFGRDRLGRLPGVAAQALVRTIGRSTIGALPGVVADLLGFLEIGLARSLVGHGGAATHAWSAPGTFVLAVVFLVAFMLYYFINWKYLSTVWPLS